MSNVDALWAELQSEDEANRRKAKAKARNSGLSGLAESLSKVQVKTPAQVDAVVGGYGSEDSTVRGDLGTVRAASSSDAQRPSERDEAGAAALQTSSNRVSDRAPVDAAAKPPASAGPEPGGVSLEDILAARKSQVSVASKGDLMGLRVGGADSDDESDDGADAIGAVHKAANVATTVGRLVNMIADPSAAVRREAFRQLDSLTLLAVTPAQASADDVVAAEDGGSDIDSDDEDEDAASERVERALADAGRDGASAESSLAYPSQTLLLPLAWPRHGLRSGDAGAVGSLVPVARQSRPRFLICRTCASSSRAAASHPVRRRLRLQYRQQTGPACAALCSTGSPTRTLSTSCHHWR